MDYSTIPRYLESPARQLFRRCVQCPDTTPSCPSCASDEECSFIPGSCDACASSKCIKNPSASSSSSSNSSPAGPIAGGVIGGILLVIALVALVWFFYIRKRRQQAEEQTALENLARLGREEEEEKAAQQASSFSDNRSKRGSTRSVFTTKSNVIPIAYIPGVTGTAQQSPEMIPPVPPVPSARGTSPPINANTDQFFLPDLRPDSTYNGYDRKSYRSTARSSIAPSEYHDAIVDPMPARQVIATRAVPISVGSQSRGGSPHHSPPLSHQNSIAGRMNRPAMGGQTGQAKQVMITRSSSNLAKGFAYEMEDTSPAPTPKIGLDRSGTASPRSMLSEDDGRYGQRLVGGRSPGSPQPPVSAVRSEFSQSRGSPVSNYGWDSNGHTNNIRNTIRDAALLGYGQQPQHTLHEIAELDGDTQSHNSDAKSPFGDRHATRTP